LETEIGLERHITNRRRPKGLWTQLDKPSTNHSNKIGDAALQSAEKTHFFSTKALSAVCCSSLREIILSSLFN
jgi:hypothetical protein